MIKLSDFVFKRLVEHGIKDVFMITGGGAMHLNDSVGTNPDIRYICNHHEQACAIAAEGYYRASGKMCAVLVTTGPGGTNALTGVIGQWLDSIPAIYISGQVKTTTLVDTYNNKKLRQIGDQEINIIDIVKPVTKYAVSVRNPKEIKYHIDKALKIAGTPRFGPVWIDIPLDIQSAYIEEKKLIEYDEKEDEVFFDFNDIDKKIKILVEKLKQSRSPLIVAGHGIRLSNSIKEFNNLINKLNMPVVTTFNGFDLLPSDHPNYAGRIGTIGTRAGNFALQNADFVLFLGTRNNIRQVGYNWKDFAKNAFKVVVDIDENELKKPTLIPDLPICFDLKYFIEKLNKSILKEKFTNYVLWLNWCRQKVKKYPVVLNEYKKINKKVNPYYFIEELTKNSSNKQIFVAGNGSACVCLFQAGIVKEEQRMFWNSGCASMGYDLPASIGAAVSIGKEVICLAGDGSLMMNLQELSVISHYKLPVKIFILNNNGYISIKQTQDNFFGRRYGCEPSNGVSFPDFEKLANSFKLKYFKISKNSEVSTKIKKLLKIKGSFVCELVLEDDYKFAPKVSSEKLKDGTIVSKPLEDMWPFLDREEFEKEFKYTGRII
ncbi:MAG: thiamine pyrophosphate-binding protein [Elusimicrobiales bacterium]